MNTLNTHFRKIALAIMLMPLASYSQNETHHFKLEWKGVQSVDQTDTLIIKALYFTDAINNSFHDYSPLFHKVFKLPEGVVSCAISIKNPVYEVVDIKDIEKLTFPILAADSLNSKSSIGIARGVTQLDLQFIPLIQSPGGMLQKLVSFDLELKYTKQTIRSVEKKTEYAVNSVLASGKWYKVRVNKTGICKVTYADIKNMGVDMTTVTPDRIRLFGKNGGMLPEANSLFRYDDLPENAIQVVTATPGIFAAGDYFLFYAMDPNEVVYNKASRLFEHRKNYYSDYTYYFLNFDGATGKRIVMQEQSKKTANNTSNTFTDFLFHEKDLLNPIISGKKWIGEKLDFSAPSIDLNTFSFLNVETSKQASIRYRLVARSLAASNFSVTANSTALTSRSIGTYSQYVFTLEAFETKSFVPVEGKQQIKITYNSSDKQALGYIDWVEVNVIRKMIFTGGQMSFADPASVGNVKITDFNLQSVSPQVVIWEVTNPTEVKKIESAPNADVMRFTLETDSLRRFIAWDNTSFNSVEFVEKGENQNLHGIAGADFLIVTHPDFLEQANRLADHHRLFDGMKVVVATNQQVYNEFSSGSPDVSAIRDLARMLYKKPDSDEKLKYLLMFGDGSYDYKDILPIKNTNYVLAFETQESQNQVNSTSSDDFFALLDPGEGNDASGKLDIGIGRFPVSSVEEAKTVVDKTIHYATNPPETMGNWRNSICFIADDEDNNLHISQVEDRVVPGIEKNHALYNIKKIYLDAYTQVITPSGARYPDVNKEINGQVQNGVLLINYTGHGGEIGLAQESILGVSEIKNWSNANWLTVFFTATCEFSRFDDPGRESAGEITLLNPNGGAVALLTTTRLALASTNLELTIDLYDTIFSKKNGQYPRLGDVIAFVKNQNSTVEYIRNFELLGDPAMQLAYPRHDVITTKINGHAIMPGSDTLSAMDAVELEGMIADGSGNLVNSFNGKVEVTVYDKFRRVMTQANDPGSYKRYFRVQDNILYQGKATVTEGKFKISFIVPRDIDYSYGLGKISYYASSVSTDAAGFYNNILIGGTNNEKNADTYGPEIKLYMNDIRFENGDVISENPLLLAYLSDESSINTVGNGIGHDLVATLDGNSESSVVLNKYYQSDLDSYRTGEVNYYYSNLAEGPHTLQLKVWDVFNNSSEATIDFVVMKDLALKITSLNAYPNPFSNEIKVEFEHNLFNSNIETTLDIFNLYGSRIRSIGPKLFNSEGYRGGTILWDGRSSEMAMVNEGIYLLRLRVSDGENISEKTVRVIKLP